MKNITLNGTSTFDTINLSRYEVRKYMESNKELQALMRKYGIVWRFKDKENYNFYEEIYFCDYNNIKYGDFTNIDNFIIELKDNFPMFLVEESSEFDRKMFGHKYDRTFWAKDEYGREYNFIYFNNYSFKEDNVLLGVDMDDKLLKVVKDYFNDVLNKDWNVIFATNGKHNFEGKIEGYDAMIVIGGGKENTRLIDQLYVFTDCVYNTKTKKLELRGHLDHYNIPYKE